jgi:hypothetical protein
MQRPTHLRSSSRRGFTTPLVAGTLLVAMMGLALVLDRLWLESARVELTTTAEAAALAAAGQLATDERLTGWRPSREALEPAAQAAVDIALQNRVAGQPVVLDPETDIRFGNRVRNEETGETPFLESTNSPTQVLITAHRTRFRGNPVALFLEDLTRQPTGDVIVEAGAGLNNHIVGVRPFAGAPVPALPLAIWQRDPTSKRTDTWDYCIEQRRGRDEFAWDERSHTVVRGADDIPELTLKTIRRGIRSLDGNAFVLDIGTGFLSDPLARQFEHGWNETDLEDFGGELRLPLTTRGLPQLSGDDRNGLDEQTGVPRIVALYSTARYTGRGPDCDVRCERLVAIRILQVTDQPDGSCHIVVQPTVLTTRTALTEADDDQSEVAENPYIYRLQLTQ